MCEPETTVHLLTMLIVLLLASIPPWGYYLDASKIYTCITKTQRKVKNMFHGPLFGNNPCKFLFNVYIAYRFVSFVLISQSVLCESNRSVRSNLLIFRMFSKCIKGQPCPFHGELTTPYHILNLVSETIEDNTMNNKLLLKLSTVFLHIVRKILFINYFCIT